ncbi:MAG: signal peptidase I [Cellulomonadaceae bacterium]|jgi:signal peptidase I|nr:signal peptidase I [Cellulomonadaceae bacterium]
MTQMMRPVRARRRPAHAKRRHIGFWKEAAIVAAVALLGSWALQSFVVQSYYIPSGSMRNTLEISDRIMVSRITPRLRDVQRGDIVVFNDFEGWLPEQYHPVRAAFAEFVKQVSSQAGPAPRHGGYLIKRIIGLPGDTVSCCTADNQVLINGQPIDEPYLHPESHPMQQHFSAVTVPDGHVWVMGDNRNHSADSRAHQDQPSGGFVPISQVRGVAFATVFPFGQATIHRAQPDVYSALAAD